MAFSQKIHESSIDTIDVQNVSQNVVSRSIRDVEILCNYSEANTTIFEHSFFNFFDVMYRHY